MTAAGHECGDLARVTCRDIVIDDLVKAQPGPHGGGTMNRGWLKHGNTPGDPSKARRCGARARTRGNQPCRAPALKGKRRCRMHGGRSTGPRTPEGRDRSKRARWKHGSYSVEAEHAFRRLKAECTAFNAAQAVRHAALFAGMRLLLTRHRTEPRNARRRHRPVADGCSARRQLRPAVGARVRRASRAQTVAERLADLINPDRALLEVARLAHADMGELFDEHGHLRPIHELPDPLVATIASINIVKRKLTAGDHATHIIQTVRFGDKPKALAMLLKYLGLLGKPVPRRTGARED